MPSAFSPVGVQCQPYAFILLSFATTYLMHRRRLYSPPSGRLELQQNNGTPLVPFPICLPYGAFINERLFAWAETVIVTYYRGLILTLKFLPPLAQLAAASLTSSRPSTSGRMIWLLPPPQTVFELPRERKYASLLVSRQHVIVSYHAIIVLMLIDAEQLRGDDVGLYALMNRLLRFLLRHRNTATAPKKTPKSGYASTATFHDGYYWVGW